MLTRKATSVLTVAAAVAGGALSVRHPRPPAGPAASCHRRSVSPAPTSTTVPAPTASPEAPTVPWAGISPGCPSAAPSTSAVEPTTSPSMATSTSTPSSPPPRSSTVTSKRSPLASCPDIPGDEGAHGRDMFTSVAKAHHAPGAGGRGDWVWPSRPLWCGRAASGARREPAPLCVRCRAPCGARCIDGCAGLIGLLQARRGARILRARTTTPLVSRHACAPENASEHSSAAVVIGCAFALGWFNRRSRSHQRASGVMRRAGAGGHHQEGPC